MAHERVFDLPLGRRVLVASGNEHGRTWRVRWLDEEASAARGAPSGRRVDQSAKEGRCRQQLSKAGYETRTNEVFVTSSRRLRRRAARAQPRGWEGVEDAPRPGGGGGRKSGICPDLGRRLGRRLGGGKGFQQRGGRSATEQRLHGVSEGAREEVGAARGEAVAVRRARRCAVVQSLL